MSIKKYSKTPKVNIKHKKNMCQHWLELSIIHCQTRNGLFTSVLLPHVLRVSSHTLALLQFTQVLYQEFEGPFHFRFMPICTSTLLHFKFGIFLLHFIYLTAIVNLGKTRDRVRGLGRVRALVILLTISPIKPKQFTQE